MSILDRTALDNVRALQRPGTPDLLGRIIDIFEKETPSAIEAINAAITAGDLETVRTQSHAIKSSAAYLGATSFSARNSQIERAARDGNLSECQQLSRELQDEYQAVSDALKQLQGLDDAA